MIAYSSWVVDSDGYAWATGWNANGQLGFGDKVQRNSFERVNIDNVKSVIGGGFATFIIQKDNTVLVSGRGNMIGLSSGDITSFRQIDMDGFEIISCGIGHTLVLKKDGTLWATGDNSYGQLGLGDKNNRNAFTKVDIDNVKRVIAGGNHTFILKNDGTVWATGSNEFGQLGIGDKGNGTERTVFTKVDIENVEDIRVGVGNTFVIKKDGTLWACGDNQYGQLGLGDKIHRKVFTRVDIEGVEDVYSGLRHVVLLKKDKSILGAGENGFGQLSFENAIESVVFKNINIENVKQIECGQNFTMVVKNDGTVWGTGLNGNGQLGIDTDIQKNFIRIRNTTDNVKLWEYSFVNKSIIKVLIYHSNKYFKLNDDRLFEEVSIVTEEDFITHGMGNVLDLITPDINGNRPIDLLSDEFEIRTWESNPKNISIEVVEPSYKPIEDLEDTFEILTYSDEESDKQLNVKAIPKENQLVIPTDDIDIRHIEGIDRCYVRESENGGSVKLVCSTDSGNTWKTFKGGNWIDVELNKESVLLNGLTTNELSEITREHWDLITENRLIRFAYLISKDSVDSTYGIDKLEIIVEMKGIWDKAIHGTDYRYKYPNNYLLKVELKTDGTYKINYGD